MPRPRRVPVSFSGIVTFKTATELHEAARLCPLDRMLAETDSPYLAPVPHRGRTEPAGVRHPRGRRRSPSCAVRPSTRCAPLRWRTHALRSRAFVRSLLTVPRTGTHTMNPYDRRRLVLASIFTVAALPALWIINRNDAGSAAPERRRCRRSASGRRHGTADLGVHARPTDLPQRSLGGRRSRRRRHRHPPRPDRNRGDGPRQLPSLSPTRRRRPCTTALAPWGRTLTVTNTNNGQTHDVRQQHQHAACPPASTS